MKKALFSFTTHQLHDAPKRLKEVLPAQWLTELLAIDEGGEAVVATEDGSLTATLGPTGDDHFLLQGTIRAVLTMPCGRCLSPARVEITSEITTFFAPARAGRKVKGKNSADSEGEFEFDASEAEMTFYDGDHVVLDEALREAIVLEVPISALCSETCVGINPAPLNPQDASHAIDPRLAQLARFADRLKK